MEFVREYIDENNKVVFEFNATQEEKEVLDNICKQYDITMDDLAERFLKYYIENPEQLKKFIEENREDKNPIGVIGSPKYKRGDIAGFYIKPYKQENSIFCIGKVEIVDSYGTFEQNEEPSYDILVEDFNGTGPCLVKHIRESSTYHIAK